MVLKDIHPVPEIDNELILFRELINIKNQRSNPLAISQAGRIAQHLVEYSVMRGNDNYYTYGSTFEELLDRLEYIPDDIKEIIFIIYKFRRDVVLSPNHIKFNNKEMIKFFETFKLVLNWFRYYYEINVAEDGVFFKEMDKTINELNKKIDKQNTGDYGENEKYNNESPLTLEDIEKLLRSLLPEFAYLLMPKIEKALQKQSRERDRQYNTLRQNQETVIQNQENMESMLIEIRDQLKELNNEIKVYQKEVNAKLNSNLTEEEFNKIMLEFTDKCITKIQKHTMNYTSTELYKVEENRLIEKFGKNWDKLSVESKTFLTTAKFTYYRMEPSEDIIDYSGVCLLVTKALEVELYNRFFKDFIKYLRDEYKKNYSQYHVSVLQQNKDNGDYYVRDEARYCDLGTITCIMGFNRWGELKDDGIYDNSIFKLIDYSRDYIFKQMKYSDEKIKEKLFEYGGYVDKIRLDYRNPAAHTDELKKINAKECFKFVLDSEKVLLKMLKTFDY